MSVLRAPLVSERYGELDGADVITSRALARWWADKPCEHRRTRDLYVTLAVCLDCGMWLERKACGGE